MLKKFKEFIKRCVDADLSKEEWKSNVIAFYARMEEENDICHKEPNPDCKCWKDGFITASAEECFNEKEEIKRLRKELKRYDGADVDTQDYPHQ